MSEYEDLTQHEIQALKREYNLADAHTHQSQSPTQQKIVESLPALWMEAEKSKQAEMEQKFIETFFKIQKQHHALKTPTMLVYAASIAMAITANYLKKKKLKVSLIHPCFDNLHDLLVHFDVPLEPLQEEWLHDADSIYDNLKKHVKADVIFIVDPNNPTGFTLSSNGKTATKGFEELFRYAKDHKKLLIFDFCFASFMLPDDELVIFEIYAMLEKYGVSYIAMEDTGKTWPLQDAKVALLKTSKDLHDEIYSIHTSYLLNVSPFILNLVSEYILDSERDNFASVYDLLERNRTIAQKELDGGVLEFQKPKSKVSVAWFKIKDPTIKSTELQKVILEHGAYVLPGTFFYWNDRVEGEHFIRIALARNTDMFEAAVKLIRKALDPIL